MTKRQKSKPGRPHRHGKEMFEVTVRVPDNRVDALRRFAGKLSQRHAAKREEVLYQLRRHRHEYERFGVKALYIFGSVARNESTRESDVDIMVEFEPGKPEGLFEFVELNSLLANIVNRPVDLITPDKIKPRLKKRITGEAVRVL